MYVIVKSQKDKGKALRKHTLKDVVPRGFDAKIEDLTSRVEAFEFMNETHQQTIEEKDAAIELLNDDQKNCEYENVALQAQRDVYQAELQTVKIPSPILKHVMFLMPEILVRQHYHHCTETYNIYQR